MEFRRLLHVFHGMTPVSLLFLGVLSTGCRIGPAYRLPSVQSAPAYKELDRLHWKQAEPSDSVNRGKWWELFQDPQLNVLEDQIDAGSQTIAAAAARYDAARAVVRQARSQYLPSVSATPSFVNARLAATPFAPVSSGTTYTEYSLPLSASWEPDLWGRVRKNVQADSYTAQSRSADLENVRLLAHASLATYYFELRGIDAQKEVLATTVVAWTKYLDLTRDLTNSGLGTDEALAAAESQLEAAQAQNTNLGIARAQYEHAIATLLGQSPAEINVSIASGDVQIPEIPVGVPAELLERRPDIAIAERTMAATNAQIGAAKTAYFPNVLLSATGGFESLSFANWLEWPSRFWSLGPAAAETIFDGGLRKATVSQYTALYDESVANYRQTALTAFQQVEDNLAALRILSQDLQQQNAAVQSAKRYLAQATNRNAAGLDPYLNVLTAQVSLLVFQQTYVSFQTQQRIAIVQLIEALGGGWTRSQLPSAKEVAHAPSTATQHRR